MVGDFRWTGMRSSGGAIVKIYVHLILFLVLLHSSVIAQPVPPGPFRISVAVTNSSISQINFSDVLEVAGYRSTSCGTEPPSGGCQLLDNANVNMDIPAFQLGVSYAWSSLVSTGLNFSTTRNTGNYYASAYSSNPEFDYLAWNASVKTIDVYTDFIIWKYPRKRQVGLQLSAEGGFSVVTLLEELDVRLPADSIQLFNLQSTVQRDYGLNAMFSFDAELFLSRHVSFIPMHLQWNLPVIRPAFQESVFDNGVSRRTLSGRNYDTSGWFWYMGLAVHF